MRLHSMTIQGFRSFKKPQNIIVDEKITIFIGANDHGKTNLLEAIRRLNDNVPIALEDKNFDLPNESNCCITWNFNLSNNEMEKIKELQVIPIRDVHEDLVKTAANKKSSIEEIPVNDKDEIIFSRESNDRVKVISVPIMNVPLSNEPQILGLRPKVELFKLPSNNIVDSINRQELNQNEFMQGIFRLAGLWEKKDEIFSISTKTTKILDEASETLSKALNEQWNQGKDLEWKIKHVGNNGDRIEINIKDTAISNTYSKPSLRSAGFQTYFLLSMIISARTANSNNGSYIFLFDEPATELHPRAQLDLQRSLEVISEKAQIAYSTHSLFLINKNYPERNCVIKKTVEGSLIDHKPFINNWKSLRESLGILMSNNFLIADKTLLVEGPSDIIYILTAIKKLKFDFKIDIDLNDFCIVDSGCMENYIAMAKLMLSEGREIVALLDGNGYGDRVENELNNICEKEISEKKLKIYKLPTNSSIENVMVDHKIFRLAILNHVNFLKEKKLLNKKEEIDFDKEVEKIIPSEDKTLGKKFEEVTKNLWDPNKTISKLAVALIYEDIIMSYLKGNEDSTRTISEVKLPDECEKVLKEIKNKLNLKGECAKFEGVFQELEQ